MQVVTEPKHVQGTIRSLPGRASTVGFVPTMGALHTGHVSLMQAARKECDFTVASIFVNPTQFGPGEDFDRYPRNLDEDLQRCREAGVDMVFAPQTSHMYPPDAESVVRVMRMTEGLEGKIRAGHFDGVTTVVAKLLNIVTPDRAYFGRKDYQQLMVVRKMVRDLNWPVEIVACPIIREADGLAMSSRNRYLSAEDRERSLILHRTLMRAEQMAAESSARPSEVAAEMVRMIGAAEGVELDYAVVVDPDSLESLPDDAKNAVALVAARLGSTRLIDNHILRFR